LSLGQFSQDTGEWPEKQILIPDWTYFHCPGATLRYAEGQQKIKIVRTNRQSNLQGSCQSIFSLCWHHPTPLHPKHNNKKPKLFAKRQKLGVADVSIFKWNILSKTAKIRSEAVSETEVRAGPMERCFWFSQATQFDLKNRI